MDKIIKPLQNVVHMHADASDLRPGQDAPTMFRVGNDANVQLKSQEAFLRVRIEEIHGFTYTGTVAEGSTDGVEPGDRVAFTDPYADHT